MRNIRIGSTKEPRLQTTINKIVTYRLNLKQLFIAVCLVFALMPTNIVLALSGAVSSNQPSQTPAKIVIKEVPPAILQTLAAEPTYKYKFILGPSVEYWETVAQCETRQDWQNEGKWAGGLGIYTVGDWRDQSMGTWERWGGEEFAPHPMYASKFQQIIVANRIAVYGYRTTVVRNPEYAERNGLPPTYFYDKKPSGFGGWGCIKSKSTKKWRIGPPKEKINFSVQLPIDTQYYCPQYEPLFEKYGLPVKLFSHIAWKVSQCNPNYSDPVSGRIGLLGIFPQFQNQIYSDTGISSELLTNPEYNAAAASWIVTNTELRMNHWDYNFKYIK